MKILSKAVDLIKKTIEFVYFIRSSNNLENYNTQYRLFHNLNDVIELMQKKNILIIDVDKLNSIREQIQIIQSAKNIIIEHGSAYTINGGMFARNSNILVLNWGIHGKGFEDILDKLVNKNNNTLYHFLSLIDWYNIHIDIQKLEDCINTLQTLNQ